MANAQNSAKKRSGGAPRPSAPPPAAPRPRLFVLREFGWRDFFQRTTWLLFLFVGYLLYLLSVKSSGFIEKIFSKGIYPPLSGLVGTLTSIFNFPIAGILIYSAIIIGLFILISSFVKFFMGQTRVPHFATVLITYVAIGGVLFACFYLLWGFNYSRIPLSNSLELKIEDRSKEELYNLCVELADKASEVRANTSKIVIDDKNIFSLEGNYQACFDKIRTDYQKLGKQIDLFSKIPSTPKAALFPRVLSRLGISGIYIPYTAEPIVNTNQPSLMIPATAAHEAAHNIGFANEEDANMVAFILCSSSDDANIKYSGIMMALAECASSLNKVDSALYTKLYNEHYSQGMKNDLSHYYKYWDQFNGKIQEISDNVNDSYLKFNGEPTGISSYGRITDLLLAYRNKYSTAFRWN